MDREPTSLQDRGTRCPECLRSLPKHDYQCSIYQQARRKLIKAGLLGGVATVGAFFLGRAQAIPAPSISSIIEPGSMVTGEHYLIYKDGSTYLARNRTTGQNDYSGTDAGVLINTIITALATSNSNTLTNQIFIRFAPGVFSCATSISIPTGTAIELHLAGAGMLISRLFYTGSNDFVVTTGSPTFPTLNMYVEDLGFIYQTGANQKFIWNLLHVNSLTVKKVLLATNDAVAGDVDSSSLGFETLQFGDLPPTAQGVVAAFINAASGNEVHFEDLAVVGCAFGLDCKNVDHLTIKQAVFAQVSCYSGSLTFANAYTNASIYFLGAGIYCQGTREIDRVHFYRCQTAILCASNAPTLVNPTPGQYVNVIGSLYSEATINSIVVQGQAFAHVQRLLIKRNGLTVFPFGTATTTNPFSISQGTISRVFIKMLISDTPTVYPTVLGNYNLPNDLTANPPVSGTIYQNLSIFAIAIYLPYYATTPGTDGKVAASVASISGGIGSNNYGPNFTEFVPGATTSAQTRTIVLIIPSGWYYRLTLTGVTALAVTALTLPS